MVTGGLPVRSRSRCAGAVIWESSGGWGPLGDGPSARRAHRTVQTVYGLFILSSFFFILTMLFHEVLFIKTVLRNKVNQYFNITKLLVNM